MKMMMRIDMRVKMKVGVKHELILRIRIRTEMIVDDIWGIMNVSHILLR